MRERKQDGENIKNKVGYNYRCWGEEKKKAGGGGPSVKGN